MCYRIYAIVLAKTFVGIIHTFNRPLAAVAPFFSIVSISDEGGFDLNYNHCPANPDLSNNPSIV
jgi:hypothetical protein